VSGVKTFWPWFGHQARSRQSLSQTHCCQNHDPTAPKTTQCTGSIRYRFSYPGNLRHMFTRDFCRISHSNDPQGRNCHDQPHPFGPRWISHLRLFPVPTAPFTGFESALDPGTKRIPRHIRRTGCQVRHNQPWFPIPHVPPCHERTLQLPCPRFEARDWSGPRLSVRGHDLTEPAKRGVACWALLALSIDP